LEVKTTNHPYYCNLGNYYVTLADNGGLIEYESWTEFIQEWGNADIDYNLLFRFDIVDACDEDDKVTGEKDLQLFYIMQRKGDFVPVIVHDIKIEDRAEIVMYLKSHWEYMKSMWSELN
jgi:predicted glutamine amidotransferase